MDLMLSLILIHRCFYHCRNVADSSGRGEDHCELVGADIDSVSIVENDFLLAPASVGKFRRIVWGNDSEFFQT